MALRRVTLAEPESDEGGPLTFEVRDRGRRVGQAELRPSRYMRGAWHMALSIDAEKDRGRGVGTEAVRECLRYAFDELDCIGVIVDIHRRNTAAIRLVEKFGFTPYGRPMGHVLMELGRKAYREDSECRS